MMKMKRVMAFAAALFIALPCTAYAAKGTGEDISPAIEWLRRNTKIEKSAAKGANISLSAADFEKAVGKDIGYISLVTLPGTEDGRLCLNGTDVIEGQTVTAASLDKLVFVPANGAESAEFKIKCSADGWSDIEIPCRISVTDGVNGTPTLNAVSSETVSGICCVASPRIYDPDGDQTSLNAVTYPQNGSVWVSDNKIYYTPNDGFIGTDTMTVTVTDIYGNTSPETTVTFNVSRNTYAIRFADMKNNAAHAAAVSLAEKSVVAFTRKDGEYYFSPQSNVSRMDFVVMLLTAGGVTPDTGVQVSLKFDDTDGIASAKLKYLKKAAEMGLIRMSDKSFSPEGGVTRMAAAEWICKMLDLSVKKPSSFTDMKDFTEDERFYAAAAVEAGLMEADGGKFEPNRIMTKSEAAIALKGVMDYLGR